MPQNPLHRAKDISRERLKNIIANLAFMLKTERLKRKMSVYEVSDATGLNADVIVRNESGAHYFKLETVEPLIYFYGMQHVNLWLLVNEPPTRQQLKHLDKMHLELKAYLKSRKRLLPGTGTQLQLPLK